MREERRARNTTRKIESEEKMDKNVKTNFANLNLY
jgi:hypothetical protein